MTSCATVVVESQPVERAVKIDSTKKNELYVRANNWMVETFKDAKSVIQFADKESGTVTGKYLLGAITGGTRYQSATYVYALIKVQVKDGAAKITITPDSFRYLKSYTLYSREKAQNDIQLLMDSFERAIKKEESNDW